MNERNVEALRLELSKAGLSTPMLDIIATNLAEQGVLVPSVLTDEDVDAIPEGIELGWFLNGPDNPVENLNALRTELVARLERIAKGESAP